MANTIKKQEIVNKLQVVLSENGLDATKKDTAVILNSVEEVLTNVLFDTSKGEYDTVRLGFGSFKTVDVPARAGVSALDGKAWNSPAHSTIRFKLAKGFKDELKKATIK